MKLIYYISIVIVVLLSACMSKNYSLIGSYYYKNYPKTTLELKDNGRFEFVDLSLFEAPNLADSSLFYLKTCGTWDRDNHFIYLNSSTDTGIISSKILNRVSSNEDYSVFTFFDIQGDTVEVNFQLNSNGTITTGVGIYHFPFWKENFKTNDTIVLACFGYDYWSYVKKDSFNYNYDILLYPEYKSDHFSNYPLRIKRSKLINTLKYNHKLIRK